MIYWPPEGNDFFSSSKIDVICFESESDVDTIPTSVSFVVCILSPLSSKLAAVCHDSKFLTKYLTDVCEANLVFSILFFGGGTDVCSTELIVGPCSGRSVKIKWKYLWEKKVKNNFKNILSIVKGYKCLFLGFPLSLIFTYIYLSIIYLHQSNTSI